MNSPKIIEQRNPIELALLEYHSEKSRIDTKIYKTLTNVDNLKDLVKMKWTNAMADIFVKVGGLKTVYTIMQHNPENEDGILVDCLQVYLKFCKMRNQYKNIINHSVLHFICNILLSHPFHEVIQLRGLECLYYFIRVNVEYLSTIRDDVALLNLLEIHLVSVNAMVNFSKNEFIVSYGSYLLGNPLLSDRDTVLKDVIPCIHKNVEYWNDHKFILYNSCRALYNLGQYDSEIRQCIIDSGVLDILKKNTQIKFYQWGKSWSKAEDIGKWDCELTAST